MNDAITELTEFGVLVVIEGMQYRRASPEEYFEFTGFSKFDIQYPETQPLKMTYTIHEGKMQCKDWRGRTVVAFLKYDHVEASTGSFTVHPRDHITLRYADGTIFHRNGRLFFPITQSTYRKPKVVTLCGSTRFYKQFQEAYYLETMERKIVLSVGFYPHATSESGHGEGVGHDSEQKGMLDELHKRKIDMSDEVLVLNVGGYIGESTAAEIQYAKLAGVAVRYLEEV